MKAAVVVGVLLVSLFLVPATAHADPAAVTTEFRPLGAAPAPSGILPIGLPLYNPRNVRVTWSEPPQNEVTVALNPVDERNLVAGANDFRSFAGHTGYVWCGIYASSDGGFTWTETRLPKTGVTASIDNGGDPSVTFDGSGGAYFACLMFDGIDTGANAIVVSRSSDGGFSWDTPVVVVSRTDPSVFHDKEWIAADPTSGPNAGNVYVSWTRFDAVGSAILFSRSTDGGLGWSAPVVLSGAQSSVQGSQPAVGPNGEVYVAWMQYGGSPGTLWIVRSLDGGATFTAPIQAATVPLPGPIYGGAPRTPHLPAIAVDRSSTSTRGTVYLATARRTFTDTDITLYRSVDSGQSWSGPVTVNDDGPGSHQFFPAVSVATNGRVDVVFYDTRNDPAGRLFDVYLARSTNGGVSFWNNVRATTVSSDPGTWFIGDYIGVASTARATHPAWTDMRDGPYQPGIGTNNEEVYVGIVWGLLPGSVVNPSP